jgi:hypothetical protein
MWNVKRVSMSGPLTDILAGGVRPVADERRRHHRGGKL